MRTTTDEQGLPIAILDGNDGDMGRTDLYGEGLVARQPDGG